MYWYDLAHILIRECGYDIDDLRDKTIDQLNDMIRENRNKNRTERQIRDNECNPLTGKEI